MFVVYAIRDGHRRVAAANALGARSIAIITA
jgi:ParB-like chromosome segregation protein Spo0J